MALTLRFTGFTARVAGCAVRGAERELKASDFRNVLTKWFQVIEVFRIQELSHIKTLNL
jgi:hypothetical protein